MSEIQINHISVKDMEKIVIRKIPVTYVKYDYKKDILADVRQLDLDNRIDVLIGLLDRGFVYCLKQFFYGLYKIFYFLYVIVGEYEIKRGFAKENMKCQFNPTFSEKELNEFALLINRDFTNNQIKEMISIKKGIMINSWRQLSKIRSIRQKFPA